MTKFEHLKQEISLLSVHEDWQTVVEEWELTDIYFADNHQTCLCTHYPIAEICCLTNKLTKTTAEVGNCCVKRFMDLPSNTIFDAVKRIKKDASKALNAPAISLFYKRNYLTEWEINFYKDTCRKRNLSEKQQEIRIRINQKIIRKLNGSARYPEQK